MESTSDMHNTDCPPNYKSTKNNQKMTPSESPKAETNSSQHVLEILKREVIQIDDDNSDFEVLDISTNDEICAGTERNAGCKNETYYQGVDPLGLLEPIDYGSSKSGSALDGKGESGDESIEDKSNHHNLSEMWLMRMRRWPWLLHQESDGDFGFCLYCNVFINVCKNQKHLREHNLWLYHVERANNYLEFLNSDEYQKNFDQNNEVQYEFGTDEYVSAMKKKREREDDVLYKYNWKRWLSSHSWLRRFQQEKTVGICVYCNVRMNIEIQYVRRRHENSKGHRKEKQAWIDRNRKQRASRKDRVDRNESERVKSPKKHSTTETLKGDDTESAEMMIYNEEQKQNERGIWVLDTINPNVTYCNVCCKRFICGHSEKKRTLHENSENHLAAVAALESTNKKEAAQTGPVKSEVQPESQAYKQEPHVRWRVVRRVSFMDRTTKICTVCRMYFCNESSKLKHFKSERHKNMVSQYKARQKQRLERTLGNEEAIKKGKKEECKETAKSEPTTMLDKVMAWNKFYPWVSCKRIESRANYGWCNLCEAPVFMPSIKYAAKHQRSPRHRMCFQRGMHVRYLTRGRSAAKLQTDKPKPKPDSAPLGDKCQWMQSTDNNSADTLASESDMEVDQDSRGYMNVKSDSIPGGPLPSKQRRIATDEDHLLRIFRDSEGSRNNERNQLELAKDMIISSFDIVSRLRKLDHEHESEDTVRRSAAHAQPRDTMDLFFESIVQTMKALPIDLAAEGKAKIMQIVSDLELRDIQRKASITTNSTSNQDPSQVIECSISSTPEPITDAKAKQPSNPPVMSYRVQPISQSDSTVTSQQLSSAAGKTDIVKGNDVLCIVAATTQNDRNGSQKGYTVLNSAKSGMLSKLSNITSASDKSKTLKLTSINPQGKPIFTKSGIYPVKIMEPGQIIKQTRTQGQAQKIQESNKLQIPAKAPIRELAQIHDNAAKRKTMPLRENVPIPKKTSNGNQAHMQGLSKMRDQSNEKKQPQIPNTLSMPSEKQVKSSSVPSARI